MPEPADTVEACAPSLPVASAAAGTPTATSESSGSRGAAFAAGVVERCTCSQPCGLVECGAPVAAPTQPPPAADDAAAAVEWHADARALLSRALGGRRFAVLAAALATPPATTCVRVNTLRCSPDAARARLAELVGGGGGGPIRGVDGVPEALLVPGERLPLCRSAARGREVAVNRRCAEAVLRGSDVYVPGVFGASAGLEAGDLVAVTLVLEPVLGAPSCGMTRGTRLPACSSDGAEGDGGSSRRPLLGLGVAALSRGALFRASGGLAVRVTRRAWEPGLSGSGLASAGLAGWLQIQALPSLVAARALFATLPPGCAAAAPRVLDMCSSPGGKAAALAALLGGRGEIVALDVNATKVNAVRAVRLPFGGGRRRKK